MQTTAHGLQLALRRLRNNKGLLRGGREPCWHAAYTATHLYAGPGRSVWVSAGNARSTSEQYKFSLGTRKDQFFLPGRPCCLHVLKKLWWILSCWFPEVNVIAHSLLLQLRRLGVIFHTSITFIPGLYLRNKNRQLRQSNYVDRIKQIIWLGRIWWNVNVWVLWLAGPYEICFIFSQIIIIIYLFFISNVL